METTKKILIILFHVVTLGYFIPTLIAFRRDHDNQVPIALLNFFLGWTLIGWVASLVWAFTYQPETILA